MAGRTVQANRSVVATALLTLDNGKPPDYVNYPMFGNLLDLPYTRNVTILASRQVGKSVYAASRTIITSLTPYHKFVYVAPSMKQLDEFSKLKLGLMLNRSPILHKLLLDKNSPLIPPGMMVTTGAISNDVHTKIFANAALINLSYASDERGVDRLRGKTADEVTIDEAQNTDLSALMPVILPMLTQAKRPIINTYGTPLTEHDSLVQRFDVSTQHTMVIKCSGCNRWTTLDTFRVVGKFGLICPRCGKGLDACNGVHVPMNRASHHLGVHINRLMLPGTAATEIRWQQLINDIEDPNSSEDKVVREILGRPSGTSSEMLTSEDIAKMATLPHKYFGKDLSTVIFESSQERSKAGKTAYRYLHAVDWGGGAMSLSKDGADSKSRTAEVLYGIHADGGYLSFDILYYRLHPLAHPRHALDEILDNLRSLPYMSFATCDALGGTFAISTIREELAKLSTRISFLPIQLGTLSGATLFREDDEGDRITVDKSRVMTKFFTACLRNKVHFQKDNSRVLKDIVDQFLAEAEFENEAHKRLWRKKSGRNDDVLLAAVFGYVAAAFFLEQSLIE